MTDPRSIACDATFMIAYIGLAAAMAALSLLLLALLALGIEFGPQQTTAAVVNVLGWILLPFGPKLYRWLMGHRFSWRANGTLGAHVEA